MTDNFNYNLEQENILPCVYMCKYAYLDEVVLPSLSPDKHLNLYIDTKNAIPILHDPAIMNKLLMDYNSNSDRYTIARTIVVLANHWMNYFRKRGIGCSIFFFDDRGNSVYHNSIDRNYKSNRMQTKTRIATELDISESIIHKFALIYDRNVMLISNLFKILNNLFYVKLKDIESDFVPKLLMNEYFTKDGKLSNDYTHIILSNDKDFTQLLTHNNVYQLARKNQTKTWEFRDSRNAMSKFMSKEFIESATLLNAEFIPLILGAAGDTIDGFSGIYGVGKKGFFKYLNELYTTNVISDNDYSADSLLAKIKEYSKVDIKLSNNRITKLLLAAEETLIDSYKLASFKEMLDWLPYDTKARILSQLEKNNSTNDERYTLLKQLCLYERSFKSLL